MFFYFRHSKKLWFISTSKGFSLKGRQTRDRMTSGSSSNICVNVVSKFFFFLLFQSLTETEKLSLARAIPVAAKDGTFYFPIE